MATTRSLGRLAVEALAIVASILIAFGIDAAWDTRQEQREVRRILEGLQAEFQAHRVDLEAQLVRTEGVVTSLSPLFQNASERSPLTDQQWNDAAPAAREIFDWDVRGGVLEGAVAGGKLGLIDNLELQGALSTWPGLVDDVLDNQHLMQSFVLEVVVPTLARAHAPIWATDSLSAADRTAYIQVLSDPEVLALLAQKSFFFTNSVEDIERARDATDGILRLIGRELDG